MKKIHPKCSQSSKLVNEVELVCGLGSRAHLCIPFLQEQAQLEAEVLSDGLPSLSEPENDTPAADTALDTLLSMGTPLCPISLSTFDKHLPSLLGQGQHCRSIRQANELAQAHDSSWPLWVASDNGAFNTARLAKEPCIQIA